MEDKPDSPAPAAPQQEELVRLAQYRMPFGKYKGFFLIDIPEQYLIWFQRKGNPEGRLGDMMRAAYEIKLNGLEHLVRPLRRE
jgi:uncharacterized protein (DUF3820 family)